MNQIVYITRGEDGKVNGVWYRAQSGLQMFPLPSEHPDVQAFLNPGPGFPVLHKWQLWLAALELEPPMYKANILQTIDALPGKTPQEKEAIRIMIEDVQEYHREDHRIDLLGQAMGIPPVQMDGLWYWAAMFQPGS
jgi:hypothetical protein